jgi:signal transduction protein with GAF and PtsI domain
MSRFDLRDISERLGRSADAEAVVFELLGALQGAHPHWHATLSFYEVSRDALVRCYERKADRLTTRDLVVAVDQLPARMIRGFFHPNSMFEPPGRHSILPPMVHTVPAFVPETNDVVLLRQILPVANWNSCACLPLMEREEMLAVLVLVSERRGDFGPKVMEEVLQLKGVAAMALAQRLQRATRNVVASGGDEARRAAAEFQERIEQITMHARELEQDLKSKTKKAAAAPVQNGQDASNHKRELEKVKTALAGAEESRARATKSLSEASKQLGIAEARIDELRRTHEFMRDAYALLAAEHDPRQFPGQMVTWMSERLGVDRCSVMLIDRSGHLMRIAFQSGIPSELADKVRVRVGQGVAGWVALHRQPLLVRVPEDGPEDVEIENRDDYNSDSFVCAPIVYSGRVAGVINLSNRKDGQPFDGADLDRAVLAAGVFAITLGANEVVRRALAWAA